MDWKTIAKVEGSLEEVKRIRECIDDLSRVQEDAVLTSMGIVLGSDISDDCSDSDDGVYLIAYSFTNIVYK